jgi:hypothetical protein
LSSLIAPVIARYETNPPHLVREEARGGLVTLTQN